MRKTDELEAGSYERTASTGGLQPAARCRVVASTKASRQVAHPRSACPRQDLHEHPGLVRDARYPAEHGRSDHNHKAVIMTPRYRTTDSGEDVTVAVRSQDPNGRALVGQAITNTDWTPLCRLERCDEMTQTFYSTVTGLIDYYLPLRTVKRHTTDKPWVTDQFRLLIRCRQNALKNGQVARYRVYSNRVAYSGCQRYCNGNTTLGR